MATEKKSALTEPRCRGQKRGSHRVVPPSGEAKNPLMSKTETKVPMGGRHQMRILHDKLCIPPVVTPPKVNMYIYSIYICVHICIYVYICSFLSSYVPKQLVQLRVSHIFSTTSIANPDPKSVAPAWLPG